MTRPSWLVRVVPWIITQSAGSRFGRRCSWEGFSRASKCWASQQPEHLRKSGFCLLPCSWVSHVTAWERARALGSLKALKKNMQGTKQICHPECYPGKKEGQKSPSHGKSQGWVFFGFFFFFLNVVKTSRGVDHSVSAIMEEIQAVC